MKNKKKPKVVNFNENFFICSKCNKQFTHNPSYFGKKEVCSDCLPICIRQNVPEFFNAGSYFALDSDNEGD